MGYTHYWKHRKIPDEKWAPFLRDVKKVFNHPEVRALIRFEDDSEDPPRADAEVIRFNGRDGNGYETFLLCKEERLGFAFCKTSRKPYDMVVTAILLLAHKHLSPELTISSDGSWVEWLGGRELYEAVFGETATNPFPFDGD